MPFNMPSFEIQALIKTAVDAIKTVVDSIKTTTDTTKTGVDNLNTKQDSLLLKIQNGALKQNIAVFDKPGTYTWKCPDDVTVVVLTMFGGGASGSAFKLPQSGYATNEGMAYGGGGASYINKKCFKVIPGTDYTLIVGAGGPSAVAPSGYNSIDTGKSGAASSAFGVTCPGGSGTTLVVSPTGTVLGNKSAATPFPKGGTTDSISTYTPFGKGGENAITNAGGSYYQYAGGGGAGYGDGGNADSISPVGYGCGSGATFNKNSAKGGDGIIIIEY